MAKQDRFGKIEDPIGVQWQEEASARWAQAEARAERARASAENPNEAPSAFALYDAPPLPDFSEDAHPSVTGEILGRFVYQPGTRLVHDVTRATPGCRIDQERPRLFVHFAHEIEGAVPAEAEPHAACMG